MIDESISEKVSALTNENARLRARCIDLQNKIDNMAAEQVAGKKGQIINELRKRIAELEAKRN